MRLAQVTGTSALMFSQPKENWWRLLVWLVLGFAIYVLCGRRHSALRNATTQPPLPGE
ncbi:MAG TPA: amino acid permease C-terminal domain-containing protein [Opitutaceae bacterium]|nr:amino acid permease C-terminal domain-containing protein [Opitutaceae bacterium]